MIDVRITYNQFSGLGIVANRNIYPNEVLISDSVFVVSGLPKSHPLNDYLFCWEEKTEDKKEIECLSLGLSMLINHGTKPNCEVVTDKSNNTLKIVSLLHINKDEELFFDYGIPLWFKERPSMGEELANSSGEYAPPNNRMAKRIK